MDVLNIVVNVLHLIADVVIGATQITWMISKAKHDSNNKK